MSVLFIDFSERVTRGRESVPSTHVVSGNTGWWNYYNISPINSILHIFQCPIYCPHQRHRIFIPAFIWCYSRLYPWSSSFYYLHNSTHCSTSFLGHESITNSTCSLHRWQSNFLFFFPYNFPQTSFLKYPKTSKSLSEA